MTTDHPRDLVGKARIRVFSLADPTLLMAEGVVIAYDDGPSLLLCHDDGTRSSWSVWLPREVVGPAEAVSSTPAEPRHVKSNTPATFWAARERAAYERGKAEGLGHAVEHVARLLGYGLELEGSTGASVEDAAELLTVALETAREQGIAEGLRQATEGWKREWGFKHGDDSQPEPCGRCQGVLQGTLAAGRAPDSDTFSRLVGPWEPAEQPEGSDR